MTCYNCGAELVPGAETCPHCGAPCEPRRDDAQPQDAAPTDSHPYHKLGGFLKLLAVFYYATQILSAISLIAALGMIVVEIVKKGMFTSNSFRWFLASGLNLWYSHRLWMLIRFRDSIFLYFFQKNTMIRLAVLFLFGIPMIGFLRTVIALAVSTIVFLLVNLYYVKSVRVRTYMENEAYLRVSVFNKDTDSPEPADGVGFRPEQI